MSSIASARRMRRSLTPGHSPPVIGRLVQRLARADAEEDAVLAQAAQRRERLRDHGRVVAERRREHARAHLTRSVRAAQRAEPRQDGGRVAALVAPGLEVVGDGDVVEAGALGLQREREQLRGPNCSAEAL